jgi:hypothetical protein
MFLPLEAVEKTNQNEIWMLCTSLWALTGKTMNKTLVFDLGLCISSFAFILVSFLVTEGRPLARATMGGIGILLTFLVIHFAPKPEFKKETNYQKFIFWIDILISILCFLAIMVMIGMVLGSMEELGYYSPYVPDSPGLKEESL